MNGRHDMDKVKKLIDGVESDLTLLVNNLADYDIQEFLESVIDALKTAQELLEEE
jgi:hypothetical protein